MLMDAPTELTAARAKLLLFGGARTVTQPHPALEQQSQNTSVS
jgi:hypothetical protein